MLINLLEELSAQIITKDINIDIIAIERFERKNDPENSGTINLIIPPTKARGIVPIKIDLNNLFEKKN